MEEKKQKVKPLSIIIEEARTQTFTSIYEVTQKTRLPAYLMEGIIIEVLAEVRKQKNIEIANDYAAMEGSTVGNEETRKKGEE